ncbi:MAG: cation diffusion facilitator family transporter [Hyphomicrobiaceae bacterium]
MAKSDSTTFVLIALGANLAIAVAKFAAAAWTNSSAMLSEAIHSLIDTFNQGLLYIGIKRSRRAADAAHPFGYSKELYFWGFVVAVLLFSMGAGVSIYEGAHKLTAPTPITDPFVNYIVLAIAMSLEGYSTYRAVREFNDRHKGEGLVQAVRQSKDVALFTVVLEDIAAMFGLTFALLGVLAAHQLGWHWADGLASIAIGLLLAMVAVFMSIEIRSLIIGEAVSRDVQLGLRQIIDEEAGEDKPIRAINEIRTMHLGPNDVLLAASVDFHDGLASQTVEATTARLERVIQERYPFVRRLFLEAQSVKAHHDALEREAASHPIDPSALGINRDSGGGAMGVAMGGAMEVRDNADAAVSSSVGIAANAATRATSAAVLNEQSRSAPAVPQQTKGKKRKAKKNRRRPR